MVEQLRIHMIGKRGGIILYLYIQNEGRGTRFEPTGYNLQHGPPVIGTEEEKDSLYHTVTGQQANPRTNRAQNKQTSRSHMINSAEI